MNVTEKMLRDENRKLKLAKEVIDKNADELLKEVFRLRRENARLKRWLTRYKGLGVYNSEGGVA
jgi:hypothetical protein